MGLADPRCSGDSFSGEESGFIRMCVKPVLFLVPSGNPDACVPASQLFAREREASEVPICREAYLRPCKYLLSHLYHAYHTRGNLPDVPDSGAFLHSGDGFRHSLPRRFNRKKDNHGDSTIHDASALGSRRSFRPSDSSLEPKDAGVSFRSPQ